MCHGPTRTTRAARTLSNLWSPSGSLDQRPDLTDFLSIQVAHLGDHLGHLDAHAAKRGERRRTHGPDRSVRDLERHAPAVPAPNREHSLGPALYEEVRRLHEVRVEPSRASDHKGLLSHRVPYAQGSKGELIGKGVARGEAGEACREAPQRQGESGHAAVVAGDEHLVLPKAADLGDETEYAVLKRVSGVAVGGGLVVFVDADGEHPRVLARAVAVDRTRHFAAADQLVCLGFVQWQMGAALQVVLGQAGLLQDGSDGGEVRLLGVVRSADYGELSVRQPEGVGCARADERERLERFGRGAGVDVGFGVANGLEYVAIGVADDETTAVDALDQRAPREGGERCVLWQTGGAWNLATHLRDR